MSEFESRAWCRMDEQIYNSGFESEELWAYGQSGFREALNTFLADYVYLYDKTLAKPPKKVLAIVQNETADVFNSTFIRQILCEIGNLHCGQYVKHQGMYWLVSTMPDNNRVYEKALLWKCKHTIRFRSPLTHNIVEYPVYSENSTQYGSGEASKTYITVGSDQHLIYLPYNAETVLLDDNFRFLMDKRGDKPNAYRVTKVDTVSYAVGEEKAKDGLIQWVAIEAQFNEETDNKDLMVADYYPEMPGDAEIVTGETGNITLTDPDGDYTIAIGDYKKIIVGFTYSDGSEVDDPPSYEIEYDLGDVVEVVESTEDNVITLYAQSDFRYVGTIIKITVYCEEWESSSSLTLKVSNW